jgi:hypothetical protein
VVSGTTGSGGGVFVDTGSQPTLTNVKVLNNSGAQTGGGVFIAGESAVTLNNCLIQGNTTTASYGPGGGLYVDGSSLTMNDCTVTRNTIHGGGGDGAGMYIFYVLDPFHITINQCTFATNANADNPTAGAGITVFFASPTITKSIIAFNNPGKAMVCLDAGDNPVVSCSDIYGNQGGNSICGTDGGHNFSLDPLFCDMAHDNYRLTMNSPCYPGHHPDGTFACDHDRIGGMDPGCVLAGVDDQANIPGATRLIGNQPNPFHPLTTIAYEIARAGRVDLRIFDVAGREVRSLAEGMRPAGRYATRWDGRNAAGALAPSGVYFYRLTVNGVEETRRMVLAR